MRLYFFLLLTVSTFIAASAFAQSTIDYDDIVAPADASPKTFEDYIVQRAWFNNASTQILDANVEIANLDKTAAKRSWIDQINANVNLNSQRQEVGFLNNQYLAPGFNYGLGINAGGLINNKLRIRRADQDIKIAEAEQNQEKLQFRAMVLDRLEQFDNARELLTIRRNAEIDAETNYTLVQSLYDQGKAQFEDLAQASEVYFRSVEATSVAKSRVSRTRLRVEEAVGVPYSKLEETREKMSVRRR
ncbi:MAG: TolC family protein [Saprospiraceae bacterium]